MKNNRSIALIQERHGHLKLALLLVLTVGLAIAPPSGSAATVTCANPPAASSCTIATGDVASAVSVTAGSANYSFTNNGQVDNSVPATASYSVSINAYSGSTSATGGAISFQNNADINTLSYGLSPNNSVISLMSQGLSVTGSGSENASAAGSVSATQTSAVSTQSTQAATSTQYSMISANSWGGNGQSNSGENTNVTAGNGGSGGAVSVTNNGSMMAYTSWGLQARLWGGAGGSANVTVTNNSGPTETGGNGANAGNVTVNNSGSISVLGFPIADTVYGFPSSNIGIAATSQGGAGGSATASDSGNHGLAMEPGAGGISGSISVTHSGSLTVGTAGSSGNASGIVAQSLGGNSGTGILNGKKQTSTFTGSGGNAGSVSVSVASGANIYLQNSGANTPVIAQSIGGGANTTAQVDSVGNVGNGNTVTVNNNALVSGSGTYGIGIIAQSIGGGGGSVQLSGNSAYAVAGGSGIGNSVSVTHAGGGSVSTSGSDAPGIVAQGLGDGGGLFTTLSNNANTLTVGSLGSNGNNGGTVNLFLGCNSGQSGSGGTNPGCTTGSGVIGTGGASSYGVLAQSIASGGGSASGGGLINFVGSSGVTGGSGEAVTVTATGNSAIQTFGDGAMGIVSQSVGGGGGNGGSARGWSASVGGSGGSGGTGGPVTVSLGTGTTDTASSVTTAGDYAAGVLAQSIAGGGGNGGYAKALGGISVAIGGSGGTGGTAGNVTVNNYGTIATSGAQSAGITAHSVAGGGGNGGASTGRSAGLISLTTAIGGSGGSAGSAGTVSIYDSGFISSTGLDAMGILAQSIAGGGGTGGAAASKATAFASGAPEIPTIAIGVSLGGSGGGGGTAGSVTVNQSGSITTTNDGALGILGQSIGGGGGNGGDSSASAVAQSIGGASTSVGLSLTFGSGGSGGTGGAGGAVTVNSTGNIFTGSTALGTGDGASAIVAQSIGGGGGNGAVGNSNTKTTTTASNYSLGIALGGAGGSSATSDTVNVNYGGTLTTTGSTARGIVAQSIGGGGGLAAGGTTANAGATVGLNFALGGSGGSGANANWVGVAPITANANIVTTGGYSDAILAQSIGGGGGAAGNADNAANSKQGNGNSSGDDSSSNSAYSMFMTLGGGNGGNGGEFVTVGNSSGPNLINATTGGVWSDGILAQSIGGGGGSSGTTSAKGEGGTYNLNASLGGGSGGSGGAVLVQGINSISASGYGSMGIVAQSIGGGGGTAVDGSDLSVSKKALTLKAGSGGGGTGGTSTVNVGNGTVSTSGMVGYGVLAQSIGGGGGVFGFGDGSNGTTIPTVDITLGNNGTANANGGTVNASIGPGGLVSTSGTLAYGIVAQSIGAAGGIMVGTEATNSQQGLSINANMGGYNEAMGTGGAVTVNSGGTVKTTGELAMGIVAQSIGGGGGMMAGHYYDFSSVSIGGSSTGEYSGGSTGNVAVTVGNSTVSQKAIVSTTGAGAWGVLAQSIGGGGGFVGDAGQGNWQGIFSNQEELGNSQSGIQAWGSHGNGGNLTVSVQPNAIIQTTGLNAHGIVAQSIGGSGGIVSLGGSSLVGSNSSYNMSGIAPNYAGSGQTAAGTVAITVNGTVSATGLGSYGIFAQSAGTTNGVVNVAISGAVYGNAAGVAIANAASGSTLVINPSGILAGGCTGVSPWDCQGNSGYAFLGMTNQAHVAVTNYGMVIGSMDPAPNKVSFNNYGNFFSGREITNLDFNDYGTTYLSQQHGLFRDVTMTGVNYRYSDNARLVIDADFEHSISDKLHLVGSSFQSMAANAIPLNVHLNTDRLIPNKKLTILTSSPDSTINPTPFQFDNKGMISSYRLDRIATLFGSEFTVSAQANFTPAGVNLRENEHSLASYFQNIWNVGINTPAQTSLSNTFARLDNANASNYEKVLSSMTSSLATAQAATTPLLAQSFMSNLMSCPTFRGAGVDMGERTCAWNRIIYGKMNYDVGQTLGYKRGDVSYQFGGQMELEDDWFLGGSMAYEDNWLNGTSTSESGNGKGLLLGLALKKQMGSWLLSASVAGGNLWTNGSRLVSLPASSGTNPLFLQAKGSNEVGFFDSKLRGSYEFAFKNWYLRPTMDIDIITTTMSTYRESGAGLYNLNVNGTTHVLFMATPLVEAGQRFDFPGTWSGINLRTYAQLGRSVISNDRWNASANLSGVPGGGNFKVTAPMPQAFGKAAVGVEVFRTGGLEAKLQWNGDFSSDFFSQYGSFRAGYNF